MKYIIILFFIGMAFSSCSGGDGEDIAPCHPNLVPTEQNSNQ